MRFRVDPVRRHGASSSVDTTTLTSLDISESLEGVFGVSSKMERLKQKLNN